MGVDGAGPADLVNVWLSTFVTTEQLVVPPGVNRGRLVPFDLELRFPDSAFGLTAAGRLVVLLPIGCDRSRRAWKADDETGRGGYRYIFAGNYRRHAVGPVEWQCGGPPGSGGN